jgi:hypothetical protein
MPKNRPIRAIAQFQPIVRLRASGAPVSGKPGTRQAGTNFERKKADNVKRILSLLFLGLAIMLGLSMAAFATDTIKYTGGYESVLDGYGAGLYSGTLNGVATEFVCDDADHEIGNGSTWKANAWTLSQVVVQNHGAFAGLHNGKNKPWEQDATYGPAGTHGGYTVPQVYSAVAYLANELLSGAIPASDSADVNGIAYAIWALMGHPGAIGITDPPKGNYWIAKGLANDTYTNSLIVFYSPDGNKIKSGPFKCDTPQEFIGEIRETPIPEPLSMALMGTLLTLAGLGLGKKMLFS